MTTTRTLLSGGALETQRLPSALEDLKFRFLSMTGYSPADLIAWNALTRRFFTRNGGDYILNDDEILHLDGPSPDPSERM